MEFMTELSVLFAITLNAMLLAVYLFKNPSQSISYELVKVSEGTK